ncbi:ABC transporter substrate-binding protein [Vogesella sp. LIG4]|uniref:substrate-binding periplasmic protein n=1 Tax=Vogesella sp. LIG4 TaxID=1192162 RepID=UPI00081FBE92|nr:transporter substrate-binding domain-containing protein [Vogesella sp. LIG4]SCK28421.1 ABC-type amino acid transport substrate-binding protein [Vogesella sp. LIG4]
MRKALAVAALLSGLSVPAAHGADEVAGVPIVIGAEDDAAPWSYSNGSGYVNDVVKLAFVSQGAKIELKTMPYARCKQLVTIGRLAGCFSMSKTATTESTISFPLRPVIEPHFLLYTRLRAEPVNCSDIYWSAGLRLALVHDYEYTSAIEDVRADPRTQVFEVNSEAVGLRMLTRQRVDAMVLALDHIKTESLLFKLAGIRAGQLKQVCDFGSMPGYVGFSRRNPQGERALRLFEKGMQQLQQNGALTQLMASWRRQSMLRLKAADYD